MSAALAVALAACSVLAGGAGQAQTPTRTGAAPAPRPTPPAARTSPSSGEDRTARSAQMNMTTYEIMMPGRDMPAKYRKPRKAPR